jgi:uncharacterized protein
MRMRDFRRLLPAAAIAAAALGAASAASAQAFVESYGSFRVPVTSYKDVPFKSVVRQQYDFSCGSASLATLLHYHYGRPVSEMDAFKAMWATGDQEKIRKVGFSLMDMKRYLSEQGFSADGYRINVGLLEQINAPTIGVINVGAYKHFVVIKGARKGKILVGDPALGLRIYTSEEFAQVWDGVVLLIRSGPTKSPQYNRSDEWGVTPGAPMSTASLESGGVSSATRNLPPLYQVLSTLDLNKFFDQ